jgi:hypothetical protein
MNESLEMLLKEEVDKALLYGDSKDYFTHYNKIAVMGEEEDKKAAYASLLYFNYRRERDKLLR